MFGKQATKKHVKTEKTSFLHRRLVRLINSVLATTSPLFNASVILAAMMYPSSFDEALSLDFLTECNPGSSPRSPQKTKWSFNPSLTSLSTSSSTTTSFPSDEEDFFQSRSEANVMLIETIDFESALLQERCNYVKEINDSLMQMSIIQKGKSWDITCNGHSYFDSSICERDLVSIDKGPEGLPNHLFYEVHEMIEVGACQLRIPLVVLIFFRRRRYAREGVGSDTVLSFCPNQTHLNRLLKFHLFLLASAL